MKKTLQPKSTSKGTAVLNKNSKTESAKKEIYDILEGCSLERRSAILKGVLADLTRHRADEKGTDE